MREKMMLWLRGREDSSTTASQISDLRQRVQALEDAAQSSIEDSGTKFMLEEFKELHQSLRHMEMRRERVFAFYWTICAAFLSLVVILYQATKDLSSLAASISVVSAILFCVGQVVIVIHVHGQSGTTDRSIRVLRARKYFVGQAPGITDYVTVRSEDYYIHQMELGSVWLLVQIWNGLLVALGVGSVFWLIYHSLNATAIAASISGVVSIVILIAVTIRLRTRVKSRTLKNLGILL